MFKLFVFALTPLDGSWTAPAEEEIPNRSAWPFYSPLVQEVLEAQQCLLVPSPPAKPNPVKHFQEDSTRHSKQ